MDPVSLIVTALAAGATKGLTDAATGAVADLYRQLQSVIRKRFQGDATAQAVLDEYIKDPDTYDKPMVKQITGAKLDTDQQVLDLARKILEQIDPSGGSRGKYTVDARWARNVQTGEHNTQYNS